MYDDQCDYFKVDSSGMVVEVEDRNSDKAKMEFYCGGRFPKNEMKLTLNLATRTVVAEEKDEPKNRDKLLKDIHKLLEIHSKRFPQYFHSGGISKDVSQS